MIGRILLIPLLILLVVAGLFLGGRNAQPVSLNYYFGAFEMRLAVALILTLLIGIVLGALAVFFGVVVRLKLQLRKARKQAASDSPRLVADT